MLSQITFADKTPVRAEIKKDSRNSKHKSSKQKKHKKSAERDKDRATPRRSASPCLEEPHPVAVLEGTTADTPLGTREPTSPTHANAPLVNDSEQMDGLLQSIFAAAPTRSAVQNHPPSTSSKTAAPRLQQISETLSGLVGDGGSDWRRRIQRRAAVKTTEQGDAMPQDDRHGGYARAGKRKGVSADDDCVGTGEKMRRPSRDIASAFGRSRFADVSDPSRQLYHSGPALPDTGTLARQHDGQGSSRPPGHGMTAADQGTMTHGSVNRAPSAASAAVGANTSAAAQLRARIRGEPMLAVSAAMSGPDGRRKNPGQAHSREQVRRPRQLQRFANGEKQQHFEDDDIHSTAALAKNAKMGVDLHDIDEAMTRNIVSKRHFRARELDVDDEYDFDGGLELSERKRRKNAAKQGKPVQTNSGSRQPLRAPSDLIESQCHRCFMGLKRNTDLTISVGMHAYMAMPERGSLGPGHVCIIPVEHTPSFRAADDDVYEELKNFQKCLISMYEAEGLSCIFFETALRVKAPRTHACIDCVPVDPDAFASAPMMFKKEITESESEWSQHHSKSIIDTSEKGLRRCVPVKFPYFHVQYGYKRGSVHVIDDENKWERGLGRSVLVSLTGGQEVEMYRRAQRLDLDTVMSRKTTFLNKWGRFDWTRQLA